MSPLTRYLLKQFSGQALGLLGVAGFLLFLVQCLRLFDVVTNKGQGILTLVGQALLGMPAILLVFFNICAGIGLGRALRALKGSSELGIIHSSGLVPTLARATALFIGVAAFLALFLAHVVEPMTNRSAVDWSSSVAADLVSRSMVPHRFVTLIDGVSMVIGTRDFAGNIGDFFLDDTRNASEERTYIARSAILTRDEKGYILRLKDGAIQYLTPAGRYSEVAFQQYDLPLDSIAASVDGSDPLSMKTSWQLLTEAPLDRDGIATLLKRNAEGLRVIAVGLLVAALAAFPNGRRRGFVLPIEFAVLAAAFIERAVASYINVSVLGMSAAAWLIIAASLLVLAMRLRVFRPVRRYRPSV